MDPVVHPGLAHLIQPIAWLQAKDHPRVPANAGHAARALATFGQRQPIVATTEGRVLDGLEWLLAARELGWKEAAVLEVADDRLTATAYELAAYRVADLGRWEQHALLESLDELDLVPALRAAAGYNDAQVRDLRRHLQPVDLPTLIDELAPPELDLGFAMPAVLAQRHAAPPPTVVPSPVPDDGAVRFKTLISFHYFRTINLAAWLGGLGPCQVFADCGAFSAKTQGADVSMHGYVAWLRKWAGSLEAFVNFDVIGNADATVRNQHEMEAQGVEALPVFHRGEDWRYLEAYCEQYPYVCLGGMVGEADPQSLTTWLAKAFGIAHKHSAVLHGFGQTREDMLAQFPWYSADSSSWGAAHRFGRVQLWDDRTATFVAVEVGDGPGVYANAELIREHGVDPEMLADREAYHHQHAVNAASAAWRRYALFLRRRHGPVNVRDGSRSPGLHLYLVDGSTTNLEFAAAHDPTKEEATA